MRRAICGTVNDRAIRRLYVRLLRLYAAWRHDSPETFLATLSVVVGNIHAGFYSDATRDRQFEEWVVGVREDFHAACLRGRTAYDGLHRDEPRNADVVH